MVKWGQLAMELMNVTREVEQEPNMPLSHLALLTGARGPALNCLTACAASTQAIGEATEILRRGDADVMIGGGRAFDDSPVRRHRLQPADRPLDRQRQSPRRQPALRCRSAAGSSSAKARAW